MCLIVSRPVALAEAEDILVEADEAAVGSHAEEEGMAVGGEDK